MATQGRMAAPQTQKRATPHRRLLTASEVKTQLHANGETVKSWALKHGFPYATVSHVLRGVNRANYGLGHTIAVALGLKWSA